MKSESREFLKALQALCRKHNVEMSGGSRFWIFGKSRKQIERFGVVAHFDPEIFGDKKLRADMAKEGLKAHLDVVDLSNVDVLQMGGCLTEAKILGLKSGTMEKIIPLYYE